MARRSMMSAVAGLLGLPASAGATGSLVRTYDAPPEDRGMRAARDGRRSANFEGERQHINSAIRAGGATLRARSRFFCAENPLGIAGKENFVAFLVGAGIVPSLQKARVRVKTAWMTAFWDWCRVCDYDGVLDYLGMQATGAGELFEVGEFFIRRHVSARHPLRLQMMASEQLPYTVVAAVPAGHVVRLGIEFDADNRRVAYHFLRYHPADSTVPAQDRMRTVRVPAEDVLHVYRVRTPGQIRGTPETRGAIIPGNLLDDYEDALLERARAGTRPIGFIERADGGSETDPSAAGGFGATATNHGDGTATLDMEPGVLIEGGPGEKLAKIDPPDPGANYSEFRYAQATRATTAMGQPYADVTGDRRRTNFSSQRADRLPFKRKIEQRQYHTLEPQMLQPVWEWFVADALLHGSVALPRGAARTVEAYRNVRHMAPRWDYVNPHEDAKTEKLLVDNLFKPRSDVVSEGGWDADQIDEQIAEDQKREARLGLVRREPTGKDANAPPAEPERDGADDPDEPDEEEDEA